MIAKNNIFNIRASKTNWVGKTGSKKGFVEFDTEEHGIRAWLVLMRTYRRRYGCTTIRQIVTRFAPPTENATERYIQFVCGQTLLTPDTTLTCRLDYCFLAVAMARMETGTWIEATAVLEVMKKYDIEII